MDGKIIAQTIPPSAAGAIGAQSVSIRMGEVTYQVQITTTIGKGQAVFNTYWFNRETGERLLRRPSEWEGNVR